MSAVDDAQAVLDKATSVRDYEARALDGAERNVAGCDTRAEKAKRDGEHAVSAKAAAEADRAAVAERLADAESTVEQAQNALEAAVAAQTANTPAAAPGDSNASAGSAEGQAV